MVQESEMIGELRMQSILCSYRPRNRVPEIVALRSVSIVDCLSRLQSDNVVPLVSQISNSPDAEK